MTLADQVIPDLAVTLTQGTYLVQLILDSAKTGTATITAGIQIDGVDQAPELVNDSTQVWKVIIPYEESHLITVFARMDGTGTAVVRWQNTQLITSRLGPPTT